MSPSSQPGRKVWRGGKGGVLVVDTQTSLFPRGQRGSCPRAGSCPGHWKPAQGQQSEQASLVHTGQDVGSTPPLFHQEPGCLRSGRANLCTCVLGIETSALRLHRPGERSPTKPTSAPGPCFGDQVPDIL